MSAIFAGHDRIAFIIAAMANELGINIPDDISIVGYDDLPFTNTHPLGLTTMHQPIYEIGQESMNLILSRIRGKKSPPKKIILRSNLVERNSVSFILK
jgi:DNA-binding LacI/PurR family transcriptional regulator